MQGLFKVDDIEKAITESNFNKGISPDLFYGTTLKDKKVRQKCIDYLLNVLKKCEIPDYMREARLILLSKTKSKEASLDDTRPVAVANNLAKIVEKAIKLKIESLKSNILTVDNYQSGFQTGIST